MEVNEIQYSYTIKEDCNITCLNDIIIELSKD